MKKGNRRAEEKRRKNFSRKFKEKSYSELNFKQSREKEPRNTDNN